MIDTPVLRFADGTERTIYTSAYVAARMKEAAETLRAVSLTSRDRPGGFRSHLPEPIRDYWDLMNSLSETERERFNREENETPPRYSATRIDRMWESIEWFYLVDWPRNRRVVWAVACGSSFRKVARRDGRSRQQIKNVWDQSTDQIAAFLNAELLAISPTPVLVRGNARTAAG